MRDLLSRHHNNLLILKTKKVFNILKLPGSKTIKNSNSARILGKMSCYSICLGAFLIPGNFRGKFHIAGHLRG